MNMHASPRTQDGLPLPGLDGTNPLGFLAALGLFKVMNTALGSRNIRVLWTPSHGTWIPVIVGHPLDAAALLQLLESHLSRQIDEHPVRILNKLEDAAEPTRRKLLFDQSIPDPRDASWLAALASTFSKPSANNQLQTARRDYYFGNLTSVIARTTRVHLERAIFHPWDYADPLDNQSLHFDPSEDRRHAHQWNKPAGDPDRKNSGGMLGANRLAIEAIPWFISLPEGDELHTVGFTGQRGKARWTWPIWDIPLSSPLISSILMLTELQERKLSSEAADRLRCRGIAAAYRTTRILVGKTPNFTPAQRVA